MIELEKDPRIGQTETTHPPGFGRSVDPEGSRLAALVRLSAQVVWMAQADGEVRHDSPTWRAFTGQTTEQFLGFGWLDAVHPEDRMRTLFAWREALRAKTKYEVSYRLRHQGTSWRWTKARGCPVLDAAGVVECWVGMNDDVTIQHNAEAALAVSELHFKTIAETVPDLIWIADAEANIEYWNPAWFEFTGLSHGESMGLNAAKVIRDDLREVALAAWTDSVRAEKSFEMELPLRDRAGRYNWFVARARPIRDEHGHILKWCGVMANIDELRRYADALRSERDLRERFVTGLVHDLRNAYGSGRGAFEQLSGDFIDDGDRRQCQTILAHSFDRVDRMVTDLLNAQLVQAGKPLPLGAASEFELGSLVRSVVESQSPAVALRTRVVALAEIVVFWSRTDVMRVLENLLGNATKYGATDEPITIELKLDGEIVDWAVHNWGPAISVDDPAEVFEFLRRIDNEQTRARSGWGIGLTLVQGIVAAHGGTIRAESSESAGTTFHVRMPRRLARCAE